MFKPKIIYKKWETIGGLVVFEFPCLSKISNLEIEISEENCQNCSHFSECEIWNDNDFLDFYGKHTFCRNHKNPIPNKKCNETLSRGYVYKYWLIRHFTTILTQSEEIEFLEEALYLCCSCYQSYLRDKLNKD
jgi:hypothetical protein